MMRLTVSNIECVKKYKKDGIIYLWVVIMKSRRISDMREYVNYDDGKKTCVKEYPMQWLPKTVQQFISEHSECLLTDPKPNDGFEISIYG